MIQKKTLSAALVTIMLIALISGCTGKSQPTRFYALTSSLEDGLMRVEEMTSSDLIVGIGPVKLADYLSQSRIVTRFDNNKIDKAEFDQWSGSLEDNITTVLADYIGHFLDTEKIVLHPWRSYIPIDYQVTVEIIKFDGQPGSQIVLEARWIIIEGDDKSIVDIKRSRIAEAVDSPGYTGLVVSQSKALGVLAEEIARSIVDHR